MKKLLLFFVCLFSLNASSFGAIISVNSSDDLQAKMNAAVAGDVLIVAGGVYGASGITFNKRLTLIGTGYLLPAGGPSSAIAQITGFVNFTTGSDLSILTGFTLSGTVSIGANNITFSRNNVNTTGGIFYLGYDGFANKNTNNVVVKQCKFQAGTITVYGAGGGAIANNYQFLNNLFDVTSITLSHGSESSGAFINNNFGANLTSGVSSDILIDYVSGVTNVSFYNNIFGFILPTVFPNGLLTASGYVPTNFHYNVLVGNGAPEANAPSATNLINQTATNLYAGWNANPQALGTDARNILKLGSPAINYGRLAPYAPASTATNAGAYGGVEPYITSGIPTGPYAYQISVPNVAANNSNIQITIKAKSSN
jgi:hypothetical protein